MSTGIQWTDETWNPVVGCTRVSSGCDHCYAFELHDMRYKANRDAAQKYRQDYAGPMTTVEALDFARHRGYPLPLPPQYDRPFSRVQLLPERLTAPLHWRKPRRVFVNSMSDLFHADVPDEFIDQVFAVMALTPHITYQVLTKRPERMRAYLSDPLVVSRWTDAYAALIISGAISSAAVNRAAEHPDRDGTFVPFPLPNVWLGTSVEDNSQIDRGLELLRCAAAVRFVSAEPLLGELRDLDLLLALKANAAGEIAPEADVRGYDRPGIQWVIVGGESGTHARPCDVGWIRGIVGQCQAAEVPVFVKQLGSRPCVMPDKTGQCWREGWDIRDRSDGTHWERYPDGTRMGLPIRLRSRHGSDPAEWPEDLRVREFPDAETHKEEA